MPVCVTPKWKKRNSLLPLHYFHVYWLNQFYYLRNYYTVLICIISLGRWLISLTMGLCCGKRFHVKTPTWRMHSQAIPRYNIDGIKHLFSTSNKTIPSCSVWIHYLIKYWHIVNFTLSNTFQFIFIQKISKWNSICSRKSILKVVCTMVVHFV